jgi:hypothetical protein
MVQLSRNESLVRGSYSKSDRSQTYPTMCAFFIFVESPHAQGANVTCPVIAGSQGLVNDRAGAYETDFCLHILTIIVVVASNRRLYLGNRETVLWQRTRCQKLMTGWRNRGRYVPPSAPVTLRSLLALRMALPGLYMGIPSATTSPSPSPSRVGRSPPTIRTRRRGSFAGSVCCRRHRSLVGFVKLKCRVGAIWKFVDYGVGKAAC